MIAELNVRRTLQKFFDALEAMDADRVAETYGEESDLIYPEGTPMAGEWREREEIRALFRNLFAHNDSITVPPEFHLAVFHPWSPKGDIRIYGDWTLVEVGVDGHVLETGVVAIMELRRWKVVRTRNSFSNMPDLVTHYATMPLPPRQATRTAAAGA